MFSNNRENHTFQTKYEKSKETYNNEDDVNKIIILTDTVMIIGKNSFETMTS